MNTPYRTGAMALCVALLALAGAMPAYAQSVPAVEDGNPECRAALQDAHDQVLAMKEAGQLNALDASRLVDDVAGPTCGFPSSKAACPSTRGNSPPTWRPSAVLQGRSPIPSA